MAKRRKLVVANWKMNGRLTSGVSLAADLAAKASATSPHSFDVVICPPATLLWPIAEVVMNSPIFLGAQDCWTTTHGAYTGDISAGMLADLGCRYVILGHSERRTLHGETSELVAAKVAAAQLAGLMTIVCVGETKEQHAQGTSELDIVRQVTSSLPEDVKASQLIIAYEPVWAIGAGKTPEIAEVRKIHTLIRQTLGTMGEVVPVLYGASITPENAGEFLDKREIDGVLVGGASLNSDAFWAIAEKCRG